MKKLITLIACLTIASSLYSTEFIDLPDSVIVHKDKIKSAVLIFEELKNCKVENGLKDSLLMGVEMKVKILESKNRKLQKDIIEEIDKNIKYNKELKLCKEESLDLLNKSLKNEKKYLKNKKNFIATIGILSSLLIIQTIIK